MNNIEKFGYILIIYGYLTILSIGSISIILVILNLLEDLFYFSIFLSEIISFLTFNNDVDTLGAYQYMAIIFTLFPLSFIVFYLIVEFLRNKKFFNFLNKFLDLYSRTFLAISSINISFFGFLTLFFTLLKIDGQISEKLLYIIAGLTMSTLFPYFYQLLIDAKQSEWSNELEIRNDTYKKFHAMNVSKNKKIDNIYFVLTIVFLIFIFVLIFFMYQETFDFSEVIDLKTLLTVIGTIFGAYFGAKTAGKYAILSVEKQIDAQEKKENAKKEEILHGTLSLYVTYLTSIETFTKTLLKDFKITEDNKFEDKNAAYLKFIKKEIESFLERLNMVDTSHIYTKNPSFFLFPIIITENLVASISDLLEALETSKEHRFKGEYSHVEAAFDELKDYRDSISNMLSNKN